MFMKMQSISVYLDIDKLLISGEKILMSEKLSYSTRTPLILLMPPLFAKVSFLGKNTTFI